MWVICAKQRIVNIKNKLSVRPTFIIIDNKRKKLKFSYTNKTKLQCGIAFVKSFSIFTKVRSIQNLQGVTIMLCRQT